MKFWQSLFIEDKNLSTFPCMEAIYLSPIKGIYQTRECRANCYVFVKSLIPELPSQKQEKTPNPCQLFLGKAFCFSCESQHWFSVNLHNWTKPLKTLFQISGFLLNQTIFLVLSPAILCLQHRHDNTLIDIFKFTIGLWVQQCLAHRPILSFPSWSLACLIYTEEHKT